jgi:hypothetical protein
MGMGMGMGMGVGSGNARTEKNPATGKRRRDHD